MPEQVPPFGMNMTLMILYPRARRSKKPATSGSYIDLQAERSATPLACCATHVQVGAQVEYSIVRSVIKRLACSIADPDLAFLGMLSSELQIVCKESAPSNALVSKKTSPKKKKSR